MALGDKALAVLKARKIKPTARWEKVWHEERAKAFMVAQMTRESQLKRVYAMLVKAQQQGMTKKQFVDNLSYFLAKDSWAPKGRGGIPYRLARIFSVNRRVSNAAGRWHRIQETKKCCLICCIRWDRPQNTEIRTSSSTARCCQSKIRSGKRTSRQTGGAANAGCGRSVKRNTLN